MKLNVLAFVGVLLVAASQAFAAFGTMKVANAHFDTIFVGGGTVYVTFTEPVLVGCSGNQGGYLTPSWPYANGTVNDVATNRMISTLMFGKANGAIFEVRYRINDQGAGWDNCAIDSIQMLHY